MKKFPRTEIIKRQQKKAAKVLKLTKEDLVLVRGGDARYGLPRPTRQGCES
jgi:hypothetical protein